MRHPGPTGLDLLGAVEDRAWFRFLERLAVDLGAASVAVLVAGDTLPDKYLTVRVKNMGAVVAREGGSLGQLALSVAPQATTDAAYEKMRDQMVAKLRELGVDAEVSVVAGPAGASAPASELGRGVALGATGAVGVWALWRLLLRPLLSPRRIAPRSTA